MTGGPKSFYSRGTFRLFCSRNFFWGTWKQKLGIAFYPDMLIFISCIKFQNTFDGSRYYELLE